ncbi:MAG: pyridoxal phosphate-dependent aminotransferase [Thaumarchaeota archaeon]|nr:pyridoxal phosphate-dependent aminotransferase [Nitrososphaerota archaeon]
MQNKNSPVLASQVRALLDQYNRMEETGEPFGTVVIAEEGQKLQAKGADVIFCAESILSTVVPDEVLDETQKTLREVAVKSEAPFLGIPELRQAIAKRFERLYDFKVNWEDEIIVTSGSMQSEYYLMSAMLDPGDEVIIPVPSFFFDIPVKLARGVPVFSKLDPKKNYLHDKKDFEKLITDKTKIITLCNPHNPTGRVLSEEELIGVMELAKKHDIYIMHDQVYERMVYDGRPYVPMCKFSEARDRLISISSFSKIFNMINYRLGFAAGPKEIISGMEMVHAFSSMGNPSLIQRGAVVALNAEFEDQHLSETIAKVQRARDYAVSKLSSVDGIRIIKPEGTNLILPDISEFGMSSMDFCKYLLVEAKVACAPGVAYHAEGQVRISLGGERINEAIDRIVEAASKLRPKMKLTGKIAA